MNNRKEQYTEVMSSAAELADYFFDQEGGDFTLAIVCEILDDLLKGKELPAACAVLKAACRVSDIKFPLEGDTYVGYLGFYLEQSVDLLIAALETRLET